MATSSMFVSCSEETTSNNEEKKVVVLEEIIEEVVEESIPLVEDFIKGKWSQIGQRCDETGNNCEEMSKESIWEFKGDSVTWSGFTHPYAVSGDTVLIAGSPYMIASEMTDTITFRAIKTNRYLKLVKM